MALRFLDETHPALPPGRRVIPRFSLIGVGLVVMLGTVSAGPWPGGSVTSADRIGALGKNVSGLAMSGGDAMWAVRDGPSELLKLERTTAGWEPVAGWDAGRSLRYENGMGDPDVEAVTVGQANDVVFVAAERDMTSPSVGRNTILRYSTLGDSPLVASRQWDLNPVLGPTAANAGVEGLSWISDEALRSLELLDQGGRIYSPNDYPDAEPGLFVVGVEGNGSIEFLVLGDDGTVTLVASVRSGLDAVMEVVWIQERGELWALCDNTCGGRVVILAIVDGAFQVSEELQLPEEVAGHNLEGLAVGNCRNGTMLTVWSDDNAADGHAIWESTLPCSRPLSSGDGESPRGDVPEAVATTSVANPDERIGQAGQAGSGWLRRGSGILLALGVVGVGVGSLGVAAARVRGQSDI